MKCPLCGHEINQDNQYRCSRFPICRYIGQNNSTLTDNIYVLFDIETTGFDKNKDRVIEIGAVKVENNRIIDEFSMLVNPGVDEYDNQIFISSRITELTGITNDMVKNEPKENEAVKRFIKWIGDIDVLAGHNLIRFDIPFMAAAAKRTHEKLQCKAVIDTLQCAKKLRLKEQGLVVNQKQSTLAAYYGLTYNAHRALDDVKACYRILNEMKKDGNRYGIEIRPETLKRS